MISKIPNDVLGIYKQLQDSGFEVFFVGGCVRDLMTKREVKDWDITTNATPEQIQQVFSESFYDNTFGTVGIPLKNVEETEHKGIIEITTYRSESEYKDRRHPEKVTWGKTIEEDLARRDFTINSIALKLTNNQELITNNYALVDPFNGQEDLQNRLIRAVGDPDQRFKEDALRLMRAIRIATVFSFTIEEKTWNAITNDAALIKEIASERVRDELLKILASEFPYEGIMLLKNAGLLDFIFPELLDGVDISQVRPGRHHTTDVFTHNILSLKFCPSPDPVVRFATLIHDIGKPKVAGTDKDGLVTFYNHEIVGAKIAREIAERLRFSKKDRDKIVSLIRWHMFTVDEHITDAAVRRFIRRVGIDNVKDMMDLRVGDRLGGGTQTAESWRLKLFKKRVEEQLQPAPFSINDLTIDGNDIMQELSLKPGPKVGEILQKLFVEVDEDLSKNTRDYLLNRLHELAQ
ncbi:MAG: HD domain-containing protein [Candidatus Levybacteria bacterium]|nr:HD domain-containing protein [Candidatus Levybacteria bacterium]